MTKKGTTNQFGNETEITKKTHKILTTTVASKKSKANRTEKKSSGEEEEEPKKKVNPRNKRPETPSSCSDRGSDCRWLKFYTLFKTVMCFVPH